MCLIKGAFVGENNFEIFLFSTWFTLTWVPPSFLFSGYWGLPSSAEVKNRWSCTSNTAYVFRIEG